MGAAPTGGVRMRDDRGNNAGSHSLLSIPLCAILCCLREEQKEKGKVLMQNTGERHIPRKAAALLIIQGQAANRVVYMQAAARSVFLFLSCTPTRV